MTRAYIGDARTLSVNTRTWPAREDRLHFQAGTSILFAHSGWSSRRETRRTRSNTGSLAAARSGLVSKVKKRTPLCGQPHRYALNTVSP